MRRKHLKLVLGTAAVVALGFWGCSQEETPSPGGGGSGGVGGDASTTTTTGSKTTSSTGGALPFVGKPCSKDEDCGKDEGARCLKDSDDVEGFAFDPDQIGGPAGGYCTKDCIEHTDCPQGAICMGQKNGFCVLECTWGVPELEYLDDPIPADKCHGRDDLMCFPLGSVYGCMPVCGSNDECGGRECSYSSGLCVDKARTGKALGGSCVVDDDKTEEDEDPCAGFCLTFIDENQQPVSYMCSARCSLGGDLMTSQNCGGLMSGLCVFGPSSDDVSAEVGDFGFCTGSCDQHDKCAWADGMFCLDNGLYDQIGLGYCFGTTDCPNGDECKADEICVKTKYGPVCLDPDPVNDPEPLFPLGEAAPGGGGGGGGGGGTGGTGGTTTTTTSP